MKKVAIQGIETSFHHVAALKHFGEEIEIVACSSFRETCDMLKENKVDYAIMAIENTIAGCLLANFFLLKEYKLRVLGEVYLHIQMNLMAKKGVKKEDIKVVQSHPIAIRQCSAFLRTMKDIEVTEKMDTAACAREIRDKDLNDTAAIANEMAAKEFGLEVLEKRIETNKQNFTRFFILGRESEKIEEANKATLSFQLGHNVGSLASALQIFSDNEINLTMIQSIPIIGSPNDYLFNVDLEWSDREKYDQAIFKLLRNVVNLSILGEYKKANRPTI